MVKSLFDKIKIILPFIGLLILAYIIYTLNIQIIIQDFLSIDPRYICYALILTIPLLIIRNAAWQIVLREQHIHIGFFQSLKIYLIGIFYGSFTPGYVGQLMRVPYLKEKTGEPYGKLFVNTVIETFVHTFSLYGMMIIGALLVLSSLPSLFPITIAWILGVSLVALFFIKKDRGIKVFRVLIQYLVPRNVKNQLTAFVDSFYVDFPRFHIMILPYILGIITWVIVFTQEYMIVIALGLQIPFTAFLLLFPIANVAGFIPITFAGLGTRELTAIFIFSTLYQAPEEKILVLSLVGFVITDIFMGFLGFLFTLTETRPETNLTAVPPE
jgi:glycosyltransferase 2 family protein